VNYLWTLLDHSGVTCTEKEYDECMYHTLAHLMEDAAGCVSPWVIQDQKDKVPICTEPEVNMDLSKLDFKWIL